MGKRSQINQTLESGILYLRKGIEDTLIKPLSALVGVSDKQTLTNKIIDGDRNTLINIPAEQVDILITSETNTTFLVYSDDIGLTQIQLSD